MQQQFSLLRAVRAKANTCPAASQGHCLKHVSSVRHWLLAPGGPQPLKPRFKRPGHHERAFHEPEDGRPQPASQPPQHEEKHRPRDAEEEDHDYKRKGGECPIAQALPLAPQDEVQGTPFTLGPLPLELLKLFGAGRRLFCDAPRGSPERPNAADVELFRKPGCCLFSQ